MLKGEEKEEPEKLSRRQLAPDPGCYLSVASILLLEEQIGDCVSSRDMGHAFHSWQEFAFNRQSSLLHNLNLAPCSASWNGVSSASSMNYT